MPCTSRVRVLRLLVVLARTPQRMVFAWIYVDAFMWSTDHRRARIELWLRGHPLCEEKKSAISDSTER